MLTSRRRFASLTLLLLGSLVFPATAQQPAPDAKTGRWEKEIQAYEAQDRTSPPPAGGAVFIGSSSIRLWKTLARDIPEIPTVNRGFGGSQIVDSTHFAERIVLPYKPRLVVMYAGSNDIAAGKSSAQVLADFQAFVRKVRASLPNTTIAFISINPSIRRWEQRDRVREANRLIEEYTRTEPRLAYLDSYGAFLGADGQPQKPLLAADNLHLSPEGYKVWTSVLKPRIVKLYEEAGAKAGS